MKNKVQKTPTANVLVECENSGSYHISHLDFQVKNVRVLSDTELLLKFEELATDSVKIELAKDLLKNQDGFARSQTSSKDGKIKYGDLIAYEKFDYKIDGKKED